MKNVLGILIFIVILSCQENKTKSMKNDKSDTFGVVPSELSSKRHPILPNEITIQLKGENGENLKIENVICHLNIYINDLNYHTYSFIPTDSNGIVRLTKEQIIQNTELKHYYDQGISLDTKPMKFDFFVKDSNSLNILIPNLKKYLSVDIDSVKQDLKNKGVSDEQIGNYISSIQQKMDSDKKLYNTIKNHKNSELDFSTSDYKITAFWTSETDYHCELR